MRPIRTHPVISALALLGLVLVAAGAVWFTTAGSVEIGVFSYAPAPESFSIAGAVLLDTRRGIALAVMVAGAIVLSATAGYAVGRRRSATLAG